MSGHAFADSSALVRRYAIEPRHEEVRALRDLVVSAVAGVEVTSALARKAHLGMLDAADTDEAIERLRDDLRGGTVESPGYAVIRATDEVLRHAAEIVRAHRLRSLDAIQLASAITAREILPACTRFACFDEKLRAAAADHGFTLVPA